MPGTDQSLSSVFVPILGSDRLLGTILTENHERENAYGEAEVRLLSTVAASMGVALENARLFDETQRLLKETEQRAAELSVINSIQEGMAAELDFQAIVDLVGDKLREVLHTGDIGIRWFDAKDKVVRFLYEFEHGARLEIPNSTPDEARWAQLSARRVPIVHNTRAELAAIGTVPGTDTAKSSVIVPIVGSDRTIGSIVVENHEREYAYSESDVRLLTTVASSMGVALENARLFDETQRLLKETEQRNAELAIINSVQAALAAELNIQGIYDAVGDKIREIFNNADMNIRIYDPRPISYTFPTSTRTASASSSSRRRFPTMALPRMCCAPAKHWSSTRHRGSHRQVRQLHDTRHAGRKSALFVPLVSGDQARGLINLFDMEKENAFSESDVRLLQTLANSMSVALENARLFDETQRLLKETEQRAAELAVINSIQEGMAAELDFQAIIDLVGDKLRVVLKSDDLSITWYDAEANRIHGLYSVEHGERLAPEGPRTPKPDGPFARMMRARRARAFNNPVEISAEGFVVHPGTDAGTLSLASIPILSGDRVLGEIILEDYQRENAFGEAELRLLSTVAASMGAALENARLLDETQRLFKESEQRAAELAIINSVQQALAAELNMQGIYDAVGDKIREIFHQSDMDIRIYDPRTGLIHYPYVYEHGKRLAIASTVLGKVGFAAHVLRTRETLVINDDMAGHVQRFGSSVLPGTTMEKSAVYVPLVAGDQARGLITLINAEREHAFGESDVRLLQTLAKA
jgi:GAF domain-containing protein